MCGIAGIVNLSGPVPIERQRVVRMADAIVHRGPDEDGYFFEPGVGLANRRLSIVGLFDGRQPISNENRSVNVVFNGELFDYPEVKQQLTARGHAFRTHCDTELLPHLWEDHGEAMIEKLRGQFAFALWDDRQKTLTLARDRFGICPLFWTRQRGPDGDYLLFASEMKALFASGMVRAKPDVRGIHHAFTFFATPGAVTCFEGVNCLLPGYFLTIRPGWNGQSPQVIERPYWEMDFPDHGQEDTRGFGPLSLTPPRQVIDEYEAVMLRSVERRLRADVPVVSYLSGGVDSSVVVALACHLRGKEGKPPIPTFTISIQDPALNERNEAAIVSHHLGADPVVVDCGRAEVLETYPELIRAAEAPVIDTACAALLMLAREVHRRGYKVAMTGEGADEWLAGYPWYKIQKILSVLDVVPSLELSDRARQAYIKATGTPAYPRATVDRIRASVGGPNAWLQVYGLFSTAKLRLFSPWMFEQLGDHNPYDDLKLNLDRAKRWHPLNRSLYIGARVQLPGLLLSHKGDRVAMNSSVETRYPFLDEEVFDFLAKLHPRWKMRGLRDKLILRHVAARWLPKEIAWRRKAMFRAPFDGFHLNEMPSFVDQLLSPESLRKTQYFDVHAVRYWRQAFRRYHSQSPRRLMIEMGLVGVVATQLWHHTYIDGTLCDLPSLAVTAGEASAIGHRNGAMMRHREAELVTR